MGEEMDGGGVPGPDDGGPGKAAQQQALSQTVGVGVRVSVVPRRGVSREELQGMVFRFKSLESLAGEPNMVTTSVCGRWKKHDPADKIDPLTVNNMLEEEADESDLEAEEEPQGSGRSLRSARNKPKVRSWCTNFQIDADIDWARALNQNAMLPVTLCSASGVTWEGVFSVDISNLLDGDTHICATFGPAPGQEARYFSSPAFGARFFQSVEISVVAAQSVLTERLALALNPLSVSLLTVRPLPGLIVEEDNPAMQPYIFDPITKTKDRFMLQKKYCLPVYGTVQVFPGLLGNSNDRILRTVGFCQGPNKVKFSLKTTFLVGDQCKDSMAERLEHEPLRVYIHDRDVPLVTTEKALKQHKEKYDRLYQGACGGVSTDLEQAQEAAESARSKASTEKPGQDQEEKAMSIDELDFRAWKEYCQILCADAEQQTRGYADVSLSELWSSSKELVDRHRYELYGMGQPGDGARYNFSHKRKSSEIKVRAAVAPLKRKICGGGEVERAELDLNSMELLVRQPGRYFEATTEVRVAASLTHPLHDHPLSLAAMGIGQPGKGKNGSAVVERGEEKTSQILERNPLFERVVFMFLYSDSQFMVRLRAAMQEINEAVLPHAESLRSYQLTEEEVEMANNGELDILTGFQVVDNEFRIVVLEGLSQQGIQTLFQRIPKIKNSEQCRILSDRTVRYTERLYTPFEVDIKVIRLRDPLRLIMQSPEIYDTFKVDLACQQALVYLANLRSTLRSNALARTQSFPTVEMLSKLESKYGESVSIEDLDGVPKAAKVRSVRDKFSGSSSSSSSSSSNNNNNDDDNAFGNNNSGADVPPLAGSSSAGALMQHNKTTASGHRRKAPTDSFNPAYLKYLSEWSERDHLEEHRQARRRVRRSLRERLEQRAAADKKLLAKFGGENGEAYLYAGQKLNFVERQQDELRRVLSKHTGVTYTYSEKFQSLGFSLVNEEQVVRDEAAANRAKFKTKRGFVYPVARSAKEDRAPRNPISDARAEELRTEWVDKHSLSERQKSRGEKLKNGKDFDCIPTNDYALFGGYHADGSRNPEFFTSVHIGGDGVELAAKEALEKEKEEWRKKVIVDNISIRPHQGIKSPKPCQLDKLRDILQTKPQKRGIKVVRNARLPSGKKVPLKPPPVSIHVGPYYE